MGSAESTPVVWGTYGDQQIVVRLNGVVLEFLGVHFNPLNSKIDITLYELYTTFCYSPVELTTLGTHKRTDRYWADHGIVLAPIQASVSFAGQVVYTIDAIDMHDLGAAK